MTLADNDGPGSDANCIVGLGLCASSGMSWAGSDCSGYQLRVLDWDGFSITLSQTTC